MGRRLNIMYMSRSCNTQHNNYVRVSNDGRMLLLFDVLVVFSELQSGVLGLFFQLNTGLEFLSSGSSTTFWGDMCLWDQPSILYLKWFISLNKMALISTPLLIGLFIFILSLNTSLLKYKYYIVVIWSYVSSVYEIRW